MNARAQPYRLDQTWGASPFRACRADRRFAYSTYVPSSEQASPGRRRPLLVVMHGTDRRPEQMRELFEPLAEELDCVLLAPLFPAAVTPDEELHNYIFLRYKEIRFDEILLSMVDEVAQTLHAAADRFWMAGFSGGAQFANRFAYLHASRLAGVSIAAPGMITSLDTGERWFAGIGGVEAEFGRPIDWQGLKRLPVQVVVGGEDTRPEVLVAPTSPLFCPGINDRGSNRVERALNLHNLLVEAGVRSQFDLVPGADHLPSELHPCVAAFFRAAFSRA